MIITDIKLNKRGMGLYLVIGLIVIVFILGSAFLFSLRTEVRQVVKIQANEIVLSIMESAAAEAAYIVRRLMNQHPKPGELRNDVYKMFRKPFVLGESPQKIKLPTVETEKLASFYGAEVETIISYSNRRLFNKDMRSRKIPEQFLDKRETYGSLAIFVRCRYGTVSKFLLVHRDVKVVNMLPPRHDFTLFVRDAANDTFNVWESRSGAIHRHFIVMNGPDTVEPYEKNGSIYLGHGKELVLDSNGEYTNLLNFTKLPPIPDADSYAPPQHPIVINLTAHVMLGPQVKRFFAKGSITGLISSWFKDPLIKHGIPHNDIDSVLAAARIPPRGQQMIAGHECSYCYVGHDVTLTNRHPVTILGKKVDVPALEYFLSGYNTSIGYRAAWVNVNRSGIDLYGTDYWRPRTKNIFDEKAQIAKRIYGNVYKSFVKLKWADVTETSSSSGSSSSGSSSSSSSSSGVKKDWAICPFLPVKPSGGDPVLLLLGKHVIPGPMLLVDKPRTGKHFQEYPWLLTNYEKFMSRVVLRPYDYLADRNRRVWKEYEHPVLGYREKVSNWWKKDWALPEFSWDKIARTYGSFDEYMAEHGGFHPKAGGKFLTLLEQERKKYREYYLILNEMVMISDFGNVKLPSNLRIAGRGILVFLIARDMTTGEGNLYIDGIEKINKKEIADNTHLTIMLLTLMPGSTKSKPKIYLTNKHVQASIVAPDSTIEIDPDLVGHDVAQGEQLGASDPRKKVRKDISIEGNLVVKELHLAPYIDPDTGKRFRGLDTGPEPENVQTKDLEIGGGGHLRYDPVFHAELDPKFSGKYYHSKYYTVSLGKRISFWRTGVLTE